MLILRDHVHRLVYRRRLFIWQHAKAFDRRAEFRKSLRAVLKPYHSGLYLDNKLISCSEAFVNITEGFDGFSQFFQYTSLA